MKNIGLLRGLIEYTVIVIAGLIGLAGYIGVTIIIVRYVGIDAIVFIALPIFYVFMRLIMRFEKFINEVKK